MKHIIWLSILLTGCSGSTETRYKGRCVELVNTGEYATVVDRGLVRLAKTKKLTKARYILDDYIYVDAKLCKGLNQGY